MGITKCWIVTEISSDPGDEGEKVVLGVFSDESAAYETRNDCQQAAVEFATKTLDLLSETLAYYEIEEIPIRKVKMHKDAVIRRSRVPQQFRR